MPSSPFISVPEGQFVSIVGASGSGKSTLMNIVGALDRQTAGHYSLDGIDITKIDDNELSSIRNKKIGFVFQTFNLIASLLMPVSPTLLLSRRRLFRQPLVLHLP